MMKSVFEFQFYSFHLVIVLNHYFLMTVYHHAFVKLLSVFFFSVFAFRVYIPSYNSSTLSKPLLQVSLHADG